MAALRGRITVRTLRVMAEHLEVDRPLSRHLGGGGWVASDWVVHDIDTVLRKHLEAYLNAHRPSGEAPVDLGRLPYPGSDEALEISEQDAAAEAELLAVMSRGG